MELGADQVQYDVEVTSDDHILVSCNGHLTRSEQFSTAARNGIERQFGWFLPPELLDLLDVAHAVHLTDRLALRRRSDRAPTDLNWVRNIHIAIPVRRPDLWNGREVRDPLERTLMFLADDRWRFSFVERQADVSATGRQGYLFDLRPRGPVTTALFSGGLDSLAGLGHQLAERPHDQFVAVSAVSTPRLIPVQRELVRALRTKFGDRVAHVQSRFGFRLRRQSYDHDETTQRTRGFLFMVLGAVSALASGSDTLSLYENGIGSLNLPISKNQYGSQATRSTDPRTLLSIAQLVSLVAGRPFSIINPYALQTKSEMCAQLSAIGIESLVAGTVSCDGYPQRQMGATQCGLCTSCLLRRLSLFSSGLQFYDRRDGYRHDVFAPTGRPEDGRFIPWRMTLAHISTLRRALAGDRAWDQLLRLYPELVTIAPAISNIMQCDSNPSEQVVRLYRRYCDEWSDFPASPPGWRVEAA